MAAVFAVHPLRAESVAWVTERKDVLSGLFFMLTLAAYAGYARRPSSVARYALVILLFALGLMSKSMLITLPLLLLLLDYWPLRRFAQSSEENMPAELGVTPHLRFPLRHLLREKLPFITISGIFAIIQIASGQDVLLSAAGMLPIGSRIANAIVSYAIYIGQIFCPVALAAFYPNLPDNLLGWKVGLALGLVLSIFACAVIWWQRRPWLLVGWLWFFCMLLPVIGIIPCGEPARADRYTYLPQIGLYLALTWMVADLFAGIRYRGLILGSASVAAIAALTVTGYQQTSHWHDSETLWNRALACTDGNYMAHECLGAALGMKNMQSEAISHHRAALAMNPGFARPANNLGFLLLQAGQTDEAIRYFRKAVELRPDYTQARFNLGNTLLATGQVDEAIQHYRRLAESSPNFARVQCNLGIAYERTARLGVPIVMHALFNAINVAAVVWGFTG